MEQVSEAAVVSLDKHRIKKTKPKFKVKCNVCSKKFTTDSKFIRTCDTCKSQEFRKYYEPVSFMVQ